MASVQVSEDERARLEAISEAMASVDGPDGDYGFGKLSPMQRQFAIGFCLTGGNAQLAAELAGYEHPHVAGHKCRLNPKISEMIRVLSLADAGSTLPIAIATLIDIAQDKGAKPETRRNAALDLAKIAHAMPSGGASVAVQVNTGNGAKDGDGNLAPSVVIQNVWDRRDARLSGIAAPMLDSETDAIEGSARRAD